MSAEQRASRASAPGPLYCGVDIGASATKLVLSDAGGAVLARVVQPSGVDYGATAEACLDQGLEELATGRERMARAVSTGYGRNNVPYAERAMTEITCHGIGCHHHFARAITIVDIGCQDNKVIRLDGAGRRVTFKMNRKCAAGTGAFLEEIALRLGLELEMLDRLAGTATEAVRLGSFCTVFTKTEILAHLRRGVAVEAIARGSFQSVVQRIMEMDPLDGEVVASGGVVAHNPTIVSILAEQLGREVLVPPYPQFTGALGAALVACGAYAGPPPPSTGNRVKADGKRVSNPDSS